MARSLKCTICIFMCIYMIFGIQAVTAEPEVIIWEPTARVVIKGAVDSAKAGEPVTVILLDKEADPQNYQSDDVGFLDQIIVSEDGGYQFSFTLNKAIERYKLVMYLAGENITKSVISATTNNKLISAQVDITRGVTAADILVNFTNDLQVENSTYVVIASYYDESNKLLLVESTPVKDLSNTFQSSDRITTQYPDGAKYLKVFVWDSTETMIPLAAPAKSDLDEVKTIACWGDSLTYGRNQGTDCSYPKVLAELTGLEVYNMGVGGETATTIAARQGALDIVIDKAFTIPADKTPVEITFKSSDGGVVTPRNASTGGWNPCTINGVEGTLSISINTEVWPRVLNWAKFTRTTPGTAVSVSAGTKLVPQAQSVNGDINIFFTGTNGGWTPANTNANDNSTEDVAALVALIQKQIANTKSDKYVVIGLTNGGTYAWDSLNAALAQAFGNRFLDAKAYLASMQALNDAGIVPTETDLQFLGEGKIPLSLNCSPEDTTHLSDVGYTLLAKQVYQKLLELGYISK